MRAKAMIIKRSLRIAGHATSISLEAAFWDALREIAARQQLSVNALVQRIDAGRGGNLSSAVRLFVLDSCRRGELGETVKPSLASSPADTATAGS